MQKSNCDQALINNDFYETLHEKWYTAQDHPIALLRAENAIRSPWVAQEIRCRRGEKLQVLDIGCGGGLLTNHLAMNGYDVTGIDLSYSSLEVAKHFDQTRKVRYLRANAYELPFKNESFDVVCAMDILEHVENPQKLIQEAARVLRKNGLFFFHTFNRNVLSYLLVIKGIDWFVKNAPQNMHVYHLFITPEEMKVMCNRESLSVDLLVGLVPNACSWAFWKILFTGKISKNFEFCFVDNLATGYCGIANKSLTTSMHISGNFRS